MEDHDLFEMLIHPVRCVHCNILIVDEHLKEQVPVLCAKHRAKFDKRGELQKYMYEKKTQFYDVVSDGEHTNPLIKLTQDGEKRSTAVLADMVRDTEQYRITKLFEVAHSLDAEMPVRIRSIGLLLDCYTSLSIQQGVRLINLMNRLMSRQDTPFDIKVKLASVMRKFIKPSAAANKKPMMTFEELREGEEEGIIEVDDALV